MKVIQLPGTIELCSKENQFRFCIGGSKEFTWKSRNGHVMNPPVSIDTFLRDSKSTNIGDFNENTK
jgi:hypothetical protein